MIWVYITAFVELFRFIPIFVILVITLAFLSSDEVYYEGSDS